MRKEPESVYDKWNMSVVICDDHLQLYWMYVKNNLSKQTIR